MELKDTVDLMLSEDYRERFRAEYYQAHCRLYKLRNLLGAYKNHCLAFELETPVDLLYVQEYLMSQYVSILRERAVFENIQLYPFVEKKRG